MTQHKDSGRKNNNSQWQRSLPAQSICWLSSLSLLGNGLVFAQTEAAVDNIVPTAESSQPATANTVKIETSKRTHRAAASEPSESKEYSGRRVRLSQRLRRRSHTASRQRVETASVEVRTRKSRRVRSENSTPVARYRKTRRNFEVSQEQKRPRRQIISQASREAKPRIEISQERREVEFSAPVRRSVPVAKPSRTPDYNNALIDPTDYSANGSNYEAPSSIIITGRSRGSRTVIGEGGKVRIRRERTERIARRNQTPSWLRRSQTAQVAPSVSRSRRHGVSRNREELLRPRNIAAAISNSSGWRSRIAVNNSNNNDNNRQVQARSYRRKIAPVANNGELASRKIAALDNNTRERASRKIAALDNNTRERASRKIAALENNTREPISRKIAPNENNTQRTWRPRTAPAIAVNPSKVNRTNRFIPNPSSFLPQVPTTANANPTVPSNALPTPITADNVAPRESTVAYNIPLTTTLPQVEQNPAIASNPTGIIFPLSVPAPITSLFGWRTHPITGDYRFHNGVDIGAAMGTPVLAASTGQVEIADNVGGYGLTVILNHSNAQQTLYGHLSEIFVQPGQWVEQGTIIGRVGNTGNSTGPHLHFEVRQLTQEGWVATDPGLQIEFALNQLMQNLQTAQTLQQPGS